jgi:hypothetical protein
MQTDDTSSGKVGDVPMPSASPDLATPEGADETVAHLAKPPATTHEPIVSPSAIPLISGEVRSVRSAHPSLFDAY